MHYTALLVLVSAAFVNGAVVTSVPRCSCANNVLDCSNRNSTTLPQAEICAEAVTVKLEGNLLESFPDGLRSFEIILASRNRLRRLPTASQLNSETRTLELNDNRIAESSDELRTLSVLRKLRLEKNNLSSLDFLPIQCNLYSLDVSENSISSLSGPLQNCSELVFLGIADNQITVLSNGVFSKMRKLKYLYLYSNRIASIPDGTFSGLNALSDLSLQMNRNITLSSHSFQGLSQLRNLDLGFNNLHYLPDGLFSHTPALVKIDLVVNKLTALSPTVFTGLNSLQELLLWDNQLTEVPLLRSCCNSLEELNLLGNAISSPSEEALRAVLRGKIHTKIGKLPVKPEALRWVLGVDDITTFVEGRCRCGGLRRSNATVNFCVDTSCGVGSANADWVAAVRAPVSLL